MKPKTKRPAHAELERHQKRLADATVALREAEDAERKATTAEEHARDKVREAFDVGADPAEPTAALTQAKAVAEGAVLAVSVWRCVSDALSVNGRCTGRRTPKP
jgi:hypothetical protein